MKLQKYTNRLISRLKINQHYKQWLLRAIRTQLAFKHGLINARQRENFQLFLLQSGQFNANFTLDELKRLQYPRSPFAMMHMSDYLRCIDFWPMEVLRSLYQEENDTHWSYPLWVDSPLVWRELERYANLRSLPDEGVSLVFSRELFQEMKESKSPDYRIWLRLQREAGQTAREYELEKERTVFPALKAHFFELFLEEELNSPVLIHLFKQFQNVNPQPVIPPEEEGEVLTALNELFPEIATNNTTLIREGLVKLNDARAVDQLLPKDLSLLFARFRKEFVAEDISTVKALNELYKNKTNFKEMLRQVKARVEGKKVSVESYKKTINTWMTQHIHPKLKVLLSNVLFISQESYLGMEALVVHFFDGAELDQDNLFSTGEWDNHLEPVSSMLNNLGYRIDPVRILKVLLTKFPLLFFDVDQTSDLWNRLLKTQMLRFLDPLEQAQVSKVGNALIQSMRTEINIAFRQPDESALDRHLTLLQVLVSGNQLVDALISVTQEHVMIRRALIDANRLVSAYTLHYLSHFYMRDYAENLALHYVTDREVKSAIHHLQHPESDAIKIRWAQSVAEIMMLQLGDTDSLELLPDFIQKNYLSHLPVRSVSMTPYAMRSFARVFQVLETHQALAKIYVTNQAYFEVLETLESMSHQQISVTMVQTLSEIQQDADIFFIEIHPNNVAASYQFRHDIENLTRDMSGWAKKQRTLVLDLTLNMINEPEIQALLLSLKTFIDAGWLNVMLIQSLTKFMQLGFDQRSGGLLAVLNNPNTWTLDIDQFQLVEPVDRSTVNYFSFFMRLESLLLNYITQIKENCRDVYEKTVSQINQFEIVESHLCQWLVTSDDGACTLGLNVSGLIARVDNLLSYDRNSVEDFLISILDHFVMPVSEAMNLPLTKRESIGFPLSSINIVLGSLRITIGLEDRSTLDHYAQMLGYLVFILNTESCITECFSLDEHGSLNDEMRSLFFSRRAQQFIGIYSNQATQFKSTIQGYDFKFHVSASGVRVDRVICDNSKNMPAKLPQGFLLLSLENFAIVILRKGHRPVSLSKLSNTAHQLMVLSCLSSSCNYPEESCSIFIENKAIFFSLDAALQEKYFYLYGPYPLGTSVKEGSTYLGIGSNGQNRIFYSFPDTSDTKRCILLNPTGMSELFPDALRLVKKGGVFTRIYDMPFYDLKFLMQESSFSSMRVAVNHPYDRADTGASDTFPCDREYTAAGQMRVQHENLVNSSYRTTIIEHDYLCAKALGVTVYKRDLGREKTAVEIDYWGVKDPVQRRFLSLMVAMYARQASNANCIARDALFNYFLFEILYSDSDDLFSTSIQLVIEFQAQLIALLERHSRSSNRPPVTLFFFKPENHQMEWPSGSPGVASTESAGLVNAGLALLGTRK